MTDGIGMDSALLEEVLIKENSVSMKAAEDLMTLSYLSRVTALSLSTAVIALRTGITDTGTFPAFKASVCMRSSPSFIRKKLNGGRDEGRTRETSGLTGRHSNHLSYTPDYNIKIPLSGFEPE